MALETFLFDIFAGDQAADEIKRQQRASLQDFTTEQGRQEDVNQPFLGGGTRAFNTLADLVHAGPGVLSDPEQAFLDTALRDTEGRLAAMGMSDSGLGRGALFNASLNARLGLRRNRLAELLPVAGFGERGANRFAQIGQFGSANRAGVRNTLGEAGAFPWLNASNALNRWEDQIINAAGTAAGGGFA